METKKISYDTLKKVLKPKQLRNILGGSSGGDICCYSPHWSDYNIYYCDDGDTCDKWAGPDGWWCCNCTACTGSK